MYIIYTVCWRWNLSLTHSKQRKAKWMRHWKCVPYRCFLIDFFLWKYGVPIFDPLGRKKQNKCALKKIVSFFFSLNLFLVPQPVLNLFLIFVFWHSWSDQTKSFFFSLYYDRSHCRLTSTMRIWYSAKMVCLVWLILVTLFIGWWPSIMDHGLTLSSAREL